MIKTTEIDKGWSLSIDKTQTIELSPDQVTRLYGALRRIKTNADLRKRVRHKWKSMVERDFQRKSENGGVAWQISQNEISWNSGLRRVKIISLPLEVFINALQEADQPAAITFFNRVTKGKWKL